LKVYAFDVEATGLSMRDKVLSIAYCASRDRVECYSGRPEAKLIKRFVSSVRREGPDVIITWNGGEFDFPFLYARARANRLKLKLGRMGEPIALIKTNIRSKHGQRLWFVHIPGRTHLDIAYAERYNPTGKLGLKDVAEKLGLMAIREDRTRMWELSQERLRRYNMNDARITYLIGMRVLKSMLA